MPRVTSCDVNYKVLDEFRHIRLTLNVNADGLFYCDVPAASDDYFVANQTYHDGGVTCRKRRDGQKQLFAKVMKHLPLAVKIGLDACHAPVVTEKHVICFNIESHISFCETPDGEVYPNGYWDKSAKWNDGKYGDHHAIRPSDRGYSLTVGAKAYTKITSRYGENEKVRYELYYKGEHHLGIENPAQKLNSWVSFTLPDGAREMPYTDEAAMFFFNLMMGMARLSKMIQDATFDDDRLMQLIASNSAGLIGFSGQTETSS